MIVDLLVSVKKDGRQAQMLHKTGRMEDVSPTLLRQWLALTTIPRRHSLGGFVSLAPNLLELPS